MTYSKKISTDCKKLIIQLVVKAIRSNRNISPHGGIVPILKQIKSSRVPQAIRKCLGKRRAQTAYGYDDIFISWVLTSMCGGTRLEHISKLKKKLSIIPGLKLPSHDTLGRVMKQVATETLTSKSISNRRFAKIVYTDYNDNIPLNRMLIDATKRIGALKEGRNYTLDIDATFISTECRGAVRKNDKNGRLGFNPMVCLIQDLPVFISMRNGDAGAKFKFKDCLENCLNLMSESKIKIGRVISDAAGYNKESFEMLDAKGIKFNVRFPFTVKMETFKEELSKCNTWRQTEIETNNYFWNCEIADIPYKMFDLPVEKTTSKTWRVVAIRIPTTKVLGINNQEELERFKAVNKKIEILSDKKVLKEHGKAYTDTNWREINNHLYKFFVTNDFEKTSEEIILEYNKRGDAERKFSYMKNDFGWRLPPFMEMNQNTVFLIAAALANNIFRGVVQTFKEKLPELRLKAGLREFQFIFIDVACELVNDTYVFYNTNMAYEKIV